MTTSSGFAYLAGHQDFATRDGRGRIVVVYGNLGVGCCEITSGN